jgi:hypothetical protein
VIMLSSYLNILCLAIDDFQWIVCLKVGWHGVCNFVSLISCFGLTMNLETVSNWFGGIMVQSLVIS